MRLETSPAEYSVRSIVSLVLQMAFAVVLFCILFALSVDTKPSPGRAINCAYDACPSYDPDALNVHIIPHSHDDVGWLKTVDQYFFQDVQNVLSSVIPALKQNPDRRFIQVETAFLKKWWDEQSDNIKQDFVDLVNSGQLEIISGGWSMNDEAATHYQSTIDQFTHGFRFLSDNLGECGKPRTGWQIDPFGHSREQASISAQLGFDSMMFVRIDHRDKDNRMSTKTGDLIWRGSESLGNTSDIFTSILYHHYSAPSSYCFDISCNDEPIVDDEDSPDYNWQKRVEDFVSHVSGRADSFPTNNILVTMGDDFKYQAALNTYINLDRLIEGFEKFPQTYNDMPIRLIYSTPTCYAKFVNQYVNDNSYELQVKTDDFMPYSDGDNSYWTGYFTSRAASKRFERSGNNILQVAKQLSAINGGSRDDLSALKDAMGVMQHHDAITGTEKAHVVKNYHLMLTAAINDATATASSALSALIAGDGSEDFEFKSCLLANVTSCEPAQGDQFTVAVYNPLSRKINAPISIPVNSDQWTILDPQGDEVAYQISDPIRDFRYINDVPLSSYNLDFVAKDVPGLGYNIYRFEKSSKKAENTKTPRSVIGYDDTSIEIDDDTGLLTHVTMNGFTLEVSQDFLYYSSDNSSGAYIFVPTPNDARPQRVTSDKVKVTQISGDVYEGVIQEFSDWVTQVIKVYNDDRSYIEFDWVVGPIDISSGVGKEVITRYSTYMKSESTFYTDSNGREILKRVKNSRPDYEYVDSQPVSGNYYPVNSKILIRDEAQGVELAVLTDRSEGGTSLDEGQVEVMVHRACQHDDGRGVGENLDEQEYDQGLVVRGKHYLVLGKTEGNGEKSVAALERDVAQRKLLAAWPFITDKDVSGSLQNLQGSALTADLPDNVQILTLEPWDDNTLLIRLEHVLAKDEDSDLSQDVTVDLSNAFSSFTITELKETTLGGNNLLEERSRLQWYNSKESETDSKVLNVEYRKLRPSADLQITLAPMQIRTFLATIS